VERCEPPAAGRAVVTAADMVAGHVVLDVSCLDRLYLNGFVARLQTPGGVVYFFHDHRGKPIGSDPYFVTVTSPGTDEGGLGHDLACSVP